MGGEPHFSTFFQRFQQMKTLFMLFTSLNASGKKWRDPHRAKALQDDTIHYFFSSQYATQPTQRGDQLIK